MRASCSLVSPEDADMVLVAMRKSQYGQEAAVIGQVEAEPAGRLLLKTALGATRIIDVLAGELLPRIC